MRGDAQHITRRGKPAVVVVSADEFDRLTRSKRSSKGGFIEHLLSQPKRPPGDSLAKGRLDVTPRDIDFSE